LFAAELFGDVLRHLKLLTRVKLNPVDDTLWSASMGSS